MRAKEFIIKRTILPEATKGFSDRKSDTMVKTLAFPDMPSSNPYKTYRFAMAMANHKIRDESGPTNNFAVISAYTKGEEEIIDAAIRKTGERTISVTDSGSQEPDSTNKISPVAKRKSNKYGI
jgi:hypothetical protein